VALVRHASNGDFRARISRYTTSPITARPRSTQSQIVDVEVDALPCGVGEGVGVGEREGDGVGDGVGEGDGDEDGVGDGCGDSDGDGFGDGDGVGFGDFDGFGVSLSVGTGVSVGEISVGCSVGENAGDSEEVGVSLPIPGRLGERVGVSIPGLLGEKLTLTPALEARDVIASPTRPEHAASSTIVAASNPSIHGRLSSRRDIARPPFAVIGTEEPVPAPSCDASAHGTRGRRAGARPLRG
jgi:hypothetical protein